MSLSEENMEATTKAQQIRDLLSQGLTVNQVAEKIGVKVQYVYDIRSRTTKKAVKVKKKLKPQTAIVAAAPEAGKIDSMKKYILHLETELLMRDGAINALRNKLYAASV